MLNPLSTFLASDYWKSRVLAPEIGTTGELTRALGIIRTRWPATYAEGGSSSSPVFILSAGWGSGSTLLQRLVVSSGNTLLWGEPHDHAVPIHRLSQMLVPVSDRWPKDNYFTTGSGNTSRQDQWIANLSPRPEALQAAHIHFIEAWLKSSAMDEGCDIWGLKEVRLTIDHARYLRWLFPKARFLFIYRDVMKSFQSCRGVPWLSVWPDHRVSPPSAFAHHWKHLLSGFLGGAAEVGGLLIRYEDLISGKTSTATISEYLGTGRIDDSILKNKLGARGAKYGDLTRRESWILRSITGDLRSQLGYD